MKKEDMKSGMILKNIITGETGVEFNGPTYGCIDHGIEVAMVYQGDDNDPKGAPPFLGTSFENLEKYEPKAEDLLTGEHIKSVCKIEKGKETCAYLMLDSNGFGCAKLSGTNLANSIDDKLRKGTMNAKGNNCGGRYRPKAF